MIFRRRRCWSFHLIFLRPHRQHMAARHPMPVNAALWPGTTELQLGRLADLGRLFLTALRKPSNACTELSIRRDRLYLSVDLQGTDSVDVFYSMRVAEGSRPGIFCCGASNFEGDDFSGFCRDSLVLCGICPAATRSEGGVQCQ